jgi:hypothetical protein
MRKAKMFYAALRYMVLYPISRWRWRSRFSKDVAWFASPREAWVHALLLDRVRRQSKHYKRVSRQ